MCREEGLAQLEERDVAFVCTLRGHPIYGSSLGVPPPRRRAPWPTPPTIPTWARRPGDRPWRPPVTNPRWPLPSPWTPRAVLPLRTPAGTHSLSHPRYGAPTSDRRASSRSPTWHSWLPSPSVSVDRPTCPSTPFSARVVPLSRGLWPSPSAWWKYLRFNQLFPSFLLFLVSFWTLLIDFVFYSSKISS